MHRDPVQLNSLVSPKEEGVRRSLWWWMLQMDQQYSMTLNRPLAISTMGDSPAPEPTMADPIIQSLSHYESHFCLLSRQILSSGPWSNPQIDKYSDDLLALERTIPSAMQFDVSWLNDDKVLPTWPLDVHAGLLHAKTHNLLILLNRQRVENGRVDNRHLRAGANANHVPRGREGVLHSCRSLLIAFEYFFTRVRPALMCWPIGQMAFNSAMILTLSMLETGETQDLMPVQQVYSAFLEINKLGIHKLAGAAVDRLGNLMKEFRTEDSTKQQVMGQQGMILLEDPGSPMSLADDLPRIQDRIAGAMGNPHLRRSTIDLGARPEISPFTKKKGSRKSAAQRAQQGQQRAAKKTDSNKSQRRPTDRRFSDSVTPRPPQRRRLNRETPTLSLMTGHPGQSVFSANSTPTVKSEATLFTPQTFEGFPNSIFAGSPNQQQSQDVRLTLDHLHTPLSHQSQSQSQPQPPPPPSRQSQQSHPPSISHQHSGSDTNAQDFMFSNQTTPYSSEFFDDHMPGQHVDEHQNHSAFDHQPYSAPFNVTGDMPGTFAAHF